MWNEKSFAERGLGPLRNMMKHLVLTRHVQDDAATGMPVPGRVAGRRDAKGEIRKAEHFTMEIVPGAVTRKKQRGNMVTVTLIRSVPGSSNLFDVHCRVTCTGPADCLLFTQPELMRAKIKQLSRTQLWSARDLIAPVLPVFRVWQVPDQKAAAGVPPSDVIDVGLPGPLACAQVGVCLLTEPVELTARRRASHQHSVRAPVRGLLSRRDPATGIAPLEGGRRSTRTMARLHDPDETIRVRVSHGKEY